MSSPILARLPAVLLCAALFADRPAAAAEPLSVRIDAAISSQAGGKLAGPTDDAEFLRRVTLDLTGTIPTSREVRDFLADTAADKRARRVDQLLASPAYARRMQQFFTVMLLERRVGKEVTDARWEAYLRDSFAANKPFDQLCREILAAEGNAPELVPALKFYLDRLPGGVELQVRDVGRLFLGRDLQCAQCHDHPLIKDYEQVHFHGLAAFLNRSFLATNPKTKDPILAEKATGTKVSFESVFIRGPKETGPRLLAEAEVELPAFEKGQEFLEPAKDGMPGVPKFRPRLILAQQLVRAENPAFVENSVNRLWYLMMGRGLVHPLDQIHSNNPPSHPELLKLLGTEFTAMKFDVKAFLRELALSQTYQRSSVLPEGMSDAPPPERYQVANMKGLSAEEMVWSYLTAAGEMPAVEAASAATPAAPANGAAAAPNLDDFLKKFRAAFASPPGEPEIDFTPSLAAALFLANDSLVLGCLKPHPANLVENLGKLTDEKAVAEELYVSVLGRMPTDEERNDVAAYLKKRGAQRTEAFGELIWSLVTTTEFCVNH